MWFLAPRASKTSFDLGGAVAGLRPTPVQCAGHRAGHMAVAGRACRVKIEDWVKCQGVTFGRQIHVSPLKGG